ncbi:RagB/SusD family nutrient uptake outer membrane protein [Mucilaginibacter hurinus]|uniref:RagB/SusD family nutrient uptake outer membrane protein n=1 Tax=Mucilaginibacter hurinus TaxID=2201324 RepID=A0A367GR72_9SPHI|nr:RagB/SusD family nutrient uptake outer membrane protein [Mucilaginibacter hurinus]RCH55191.1 RagB/SusD family nutrient uptake outer membrane protein [Mucilaginibacter hurinus]
MKKIYVPGIAIILFALMGSGFVSCTKSGFFEPSSTTNLNDSTVFADSAYSVGFLANIYIGIGYSEQADRFGNGGLDAAADESEVGSITASPSLQFATGQVNPTTVSPDNPNCGGICTVDIYNTCYKQIRAANLLLKRLPIIPLAEARKNQMKAEARFLRAWYYSLLLKHYGGVPIVGDTLYNYTDKISGKRNTYDEVLEYIITECDAAAAVLPFEQSGQTYGRASGGACMALKARVLLYSASPLFNEDSGIAGDSPLSIASAEVKPLVGHTSGTSQARWQAAADAAFAIISTGRYSLNVNNTQPGLGFYELFPKRINDEYIFQVMKPTGSANQDLERLFNPPSRAGSGGAFPYQETVDAFGMKNGKPITDPTSGYNPNNPYANRDPRLKYSIVYDQRLFPIRGSTGTIPGYSPINTFTGTYTPVDANGNPVLDDEGKQVVILEDQDAVFRGTRTGYYTNKMVDSANVAAALQAGTDRLIPLMRYAEILLNYAEALNELNADRENAFLAIEAIRQRAGLSPYTISRSLSKEEFREVIHNERRVELAFEGHRFWDVRRWKKGTELDKMMHGMEVKRSGKNVTYRVFELRKHNFRTAMYLWPLPQNEVAKSPEMRQNPGY